MRLSTDYSFLRERSSLSAGYEPCRPPHGRAMFTCANDVFPPFGEMRYHLFASRRHAE